MIKEEKSKEERDFEVISYIDNLLMNEGMKVIDFKISNTKINSKVLIKKKNGDILKCCLNSNPIEYPQMFDMCNYDAMIHYQHDNNKKVVVFSATDYYEKVSKLLTYTHIPRSKLSISRCIIQDFSTRPKNSDIFDFIMPRRFYKLIYPNKHFDELIGYKQLISTLIMAGYQPLTTDGKDPFNMNIHIIKDGLEQTIRCKKRMRYPINRDAKINYKTIALIIDDHFKILSFSKNQKTISRKSFRRIAPCTWNNKLILNTKKTVSTKVEPKVNKLLSQPQPIKKEEVIMNNNYSKINEVSLIDNTGNINKSIIMNTIETVGLMVQHNGDKNKPVESIKLIINH